MYTLGHSTYDGWVIVDGDPGYAGLFWNERPHTDNYWIVWGVVNLCNLRGYDWLDREHDKYTNPGFLLFIEKGAVCPPGY